VSQYLDELTRSSHLAGGNSAYLEDLYDAYLSNPQGVATHWREFFDSLQTPGQQDVRHQQIIDRFEALGRQQPTGSSHQPDSTETRKQAAVLRMINAYRVRGHQAANLDPLKLSPRQDIPDLKPESQGLEASDMDTHFNTGSFAGGPEMSLARLMTRLNQVYCSSIGLEYMHITNTPQRVWIQQRFESAQGQFDYSTDEKRYILEKLTAAEGMERYLHTKYVGQKRFSLEGGDSLIPMMHGLIQKAGDQSIHEVVLGMAHRGRLNVLVNILGKSAQDLFDEFEGKGSDDSSGRMGDVKYHLGFSSEMSTPGGNVHVALGFNPSHLEIINPVVSGSARARQTRRGDFAHEQVMAILIHGDAAFAGQGVNMELFNMSQARGFHVGGTMHIVINNQIGFTTSNPIDARSTLYCTEVAKMVQAPIFHVNGDDPEAVMFCMQAAADFRMQFKKDVVIDLVCYRRHGHNEADEPAATQPLMYQTIRKLPTTRELYVKQLIDEGTITEQDARAMQDQYRTALDEGRPVAEVRDEDFQSESEYVIDWAPHLNARLDEQVITYLELEHAKSLSRALLELPEGFTLHPRVKNIMDQRRKMADGEQRMDWGFAENLAYASLIDDGFGLRLVGQDCGRGTFFHRHAVLHNQPDGATHTPLAMLAKGKQEDQSTHRVVTIIDSLLSEEAVLGFEYGFASSDPDTLVIWEGQFGDFANGAQVVIDQFITSGETKWGRLCGLVMLLPHGYEGQGPEHSSARLERFLQLCAHGNIEVCVPTTPAQMFHMLRRQMVRNSRKPLIVMTPKSLLRHKDATSDYGLLTSGRFQEVIEDRVVEAHDQVKRVVLCSGKVYYDLCDMRAEKQIDIPVLRVEQLHPFPREELTEKLARYSALEEVVWCQEEPQNQGAWYQIRHHIHESIPRQTRLLFAGRPASPSPATGRYKQHVREQTALVSAALASSASQRAPK